MKAKISNEDYSLIKRHLSGISLESCQTVIDYFQKGAFQQFYSENRSVISEKIRDNLTFNTFLQLEQITDEVGDFVVHLLTCLYSYAQLLPFDTTELTQRATFYKTYQIYTAPIVCTTQSRTAFFLNCWKRISSVICLLMYSGY